MANVIRSSSWDRMKSEARVNKIFEHNEKALLARRKDYKLSKWGRDMVNQIHRDGQKEGGYSPSTSFLKELDKKGALVTKEKMEKQKKMVGNDYKAGFSE